MDQVLKRIPSTQCYIDDIIITEKIDQEHSKNLDKVMTCQQNAGLKLNKTKSEFIKDEMKYCRHLINQNGLRRPQKKIEAVVNAPSPQNVNQLR